MQLGFDVPDIQAALIATGNSSSQRAVNYLLEQRNPRPPPPRPPQPPAPSAPVNNPSQHVVSKAEYKRNKQSLVTKGAVEELKNKIESLRLDGTNINASHQLLAKALRANQNNPGNALNWILTEHSHVLSSGPPPSQKSKDIRSTSDAMRVKDDLKREAAKRKEQLVKTHSPPLSTSPRLLRNFAKPKKRKKEKMCDFFAKKKQKIGKRKKRKRKEDLARKRAFRI